MAKFASENDIPFGYNLSAVFLILFELENVTKTMEHADYLFANEDETDAFGKANGMEGASRVEIAKMMAKWKKSNPKRPRNVIIT